MDEKITMPMLASILAEKTGYPKKQCEDFLREFFVTVSDTLAKGENVKIKGLGSFRIINVAPRRSVDVNTGESIEIPGHNKIVFAASKELAEEVNEPFSIFESIELDDSYDDAKVEAHENSMIAEPLQNSESSKLSKPSEFAEPSDNSEHSELAEPSRNSQDPTSLEALDVAPSEAEIDMQVKAATSEYIIAEVDEEEEKQEVEVKESDRETENEHEHGTEAETKTDEEIAGETMRQAEELEKPRRRRFSFFMGFAAGVAVMAVALLCLWYFGLGASTDIFGGIGSDKSARLESPEVKVAKPTAVAQNADSVVADESAAVNAVEVPTKASDQSVYDTISKTRYLTTMAKEHYGNYNLWPYIYEENKSFLGHPDRIRPGTKVVIPSLSKYGIDPNNPEDIKKAKRKGLEIYSKFK